MNLLSLQVPIPLVKNNIIQGIHKVLNYTVLLEEARISNYNHSMQVPAKTIILEDAKELLKNDWDSKEFNISFTQEKLMKTYERFKLKTKTINTGIINEHPIINEILNKTPVYIEKDSVQQSLQLIELSKTVNTYESILPQNLADEHSNTKKSIERIKPIETDYNLLSLQEGIAFTGLALQEFKKSLRVKNWPDKAKYEFNNGFYTLGQLGVLCLELDKLWNQQR